MEARRLADEAVCRLQLALVPCCGISTLKVFMKPTFAFSDRRYQPCVKGQDSDHSSLSLRVLLLTVSELDCAVLPSPEDNGNMEITWIYCC